ncbi:MAG: helix-turn-helix transcriptional regulator [Chloroflexi bacterium]|nr:MAG: helix-turn-helix transcriptional regulator [Chloroflexota bacterium]
MCPSNNKGTKGLLHSSEECVSIDEVLNRVGDKWSLQVISQLGAGTLRFTELKRSVAGISQRMLTLTLRQLERDGLVERTVYPIVPPKVEYKLSDFGRTILVPVTDLANWALTYRLDIQAAREAFDSRQLEASGTKRS